MSEKTSASELRAAILRHLTKAPPSTATQLAFDLSADLGQTKNALKLLIAENKVARRELGTTSPVFTLTHRPTRQVDDTAPSWNAEKHSRPRMSGANFEKGFGRSHDVIVERRTSRTKFNPSTGTARARDVLCPDEIARGRS